MGQLPVSSLSVACCILTFFRKQEASFAGLQVSAWAMAAVHCSTLFSSKSTDNRPRPQPLPVKPVAYNLGLLCLNNGLLWGIVSSCLGHLAFLLDLHARAAPSPILDVLLRSLLAYNLESQVAQNYGPPYPKLAHNS